MTVVGLSNLEGELERIQEELPQNVNDAVEDSLQATKRRARQRLIVQDAIHTTATYRGFRQSEYSAGNRTVHRLTNSVPHAKFLEFGTGDRFGVSRWRVPKGVDPYRAPEFTTRLVGALLGWIETKPSFIPIGPPRESAGAIARSISRDSDGRSGTPPKPFMRPGWQAGKRVLDYKLRKAVDEII